MILSEMRIDCIGLHVVQIAACLESGSNAETSIINTRIYSQQ